MGRLEGKIAVVTGASSGIGLAIAKRFAQEGAELFITGRRQAELDAAVREIGGNTRGVRGDISKLADLNNLYKTVEQYGKLIDVLVANAGIGEFIPLEYVDESHFDRLFTTNVKGTVFTVQKSLPLLKEGASIILIGSVAAEAAVPAFSIYSGTKGAIRSFARAWTVELAPRKIRVNVLAPGAIVTPGWNDFASSKSELEQIMAQAASQSPFNRMGSPEEVAGAALFLASDDSSFVNGTGLYVDGGTLQF
ncbi:SDR family NAD(P)-dependent oxidoreductase [Pseudomonas chlororaphis]|uniref:Short-chain dehydrogenase n=1 Tax=Pseudomonas chlororaphis TaxID=587753 RepID=A0A0D5Y096_9PSED|nr:glucose 1-dehydrogenase [Pseudomonas chlororaphis]AKA24422.1 short-chain dehydrogenase [Pseudomonas chlororaphis]